MTSKQTNADLRINIKNARHTLRMGTISNRSKLLHKQLNQIIPKSARNLAIYMPSNGEISPLPFVQQHLNQYPRTRILLPKTYPNFAMAFHEQNSLHHNLKKNTWGLLEPTSRKTIPGKELDIILMPLVACDTHGNRIGMGAGFYDRYLSFKKQKIYLKPLLIGIAYEFQLLQNGLIEPRDWDIPCDLIVTEKRLIRCKTLSKFQA